MNKIDEHYEILKDGFKIFISKLHKFGTDSFLLADYANPKQDDIVLDLCSGCGIIAFLLHIFGNVKKIDMIELQEEAARLAKKTIKENNLEAKATMFCINLRDILKKDLRLGKYSLVTCNPPYKTNGSGIRCKDISKTISRHEIMCDINDVCAAAAAVLCHNGRLCICQRQDRLINTLRAMRENKIEPKRIRFVSYAPNVAPWLFLVEGRKCAKPYLKIEPQLFLEENGKLTEEVQRMYGKC